MKRLMKMIGPGCMVCFCIAFYCLMGIGVVHAVDTTPPEVTSISIVDKDNPDGNKVNAKGSARVTIDFIESGAVGYVSLTFQNSKGHWRELMWQHDEGQGYYKNTFKYSFPIENAFANGEYYLTGLNISDTNGNNRQYTEEDLANLGFTTIVDFYNSTADTTPPVLNGIEILNSDSIDARGYISVKLNATDNLGATNEQGQAEVVSGISYIAIGFSNEDHHDLELSWYPKSFTSGSTLKKKAHVFGNGIYKVSYISLVDNNSNSTYYYPVDHPELFSTVDINVSYSATDTRAPVITDFALKTHEITTPDLIDFDLTFTEERYAVDVALRFEGSGGSFGLNLENGEGFRLNPGSYNNLQLPVGAFTKPGEYMLTEILIQDPQNQRTYSVDYGTLEQLIPNEDDRKLTINSAFDFAEDGTLLNIPTTLETINSMSAGKTIVINSKDAHVAPKALFEAIAGQNKTVVFDDEDIQWVFNGLTVRPELCKDINVQTLIRTYSGISMGFPDDPTIVAVIFKNNGRLPGPADIRINNNYIKTKFARQTNHLFFSYAGTGLPTVVDSSADIAKDNAVETTIDHNSTYTLSASKPRLAALSSASLTKTKYTYTGKALKPSVTAVKAEKKAAAAKGYSVTYKNNKNVGKASVVIQGKGIYKGKLTKTFTINPKGTSLKTLKKQSKAIKVTWAKQSSKMSTSRITGYQILLATNSKFTKGKKTVNIKGYSKTSKTVKKLKGGKKYYVKIRTYKTVSGVKYYSGWSKVKTVKTKK